MIFSKKIAVDVPVQEWREMVEKEHEQLSIKQQCRLLSIHRSGLYYKPVGDSSLNLHLMRRIDEHFLKHPYKGTRQITDREEHPVPAPMLTPESLLLMGQEVRVL